MTNPRCLVVAGTSSGVGKTSIALALIAAFRRRGLVVAPFKVGPDFLDPTYLGRAAGRSCYNLDGWLMGEGGTRTSFARHSERADLCIVEGVMGLYDGADPAGPAGSTAEVATWLGAAVVLVVDAAGMSRSLAALVKGFATFDPDVHLGGVILNRTGSDRHAASIAESIAACRPVARVMGAFPAKSLPPLPSRHLGLVAADETVLSEAILVALADAAESSCDLSALLALAAPAASTGTTSVPAPAVGGEARRRGSRAPRIGIARDRAFHFYYPDNLDALVARGAELVEFSPLEDGCLPKGIGLLYLGGGYPEAFAKELTANRSMRASVRRHALAGRAVYAECGGLLYLGQSLELGDGSVHPMVGLLPFRGVMRTQRVGLGYVEAELFESSVLGTAGLHVRGHEFHYSEVLLSSPMDAGPWSAAYRIEPRRGAAARLEGFSSRSLLASYVHAHFAARPDIVDSLIRHCEVQRPAPHSGRRGVGAHPNLDEEPT